MKNTVGSGILDPWIIPEDLVRKLSSQNAQMRISRISKRERYTLPETNIAPETLGLEDEFPFGKAFLTGAMLRVVSGRLHILFLPDEFEWLALDGTCRCKYANYCICINRMSPIGQVLSKAGNSLFCKRRS